MDSFKKILLKIITAIAVIIALSFLFKILWNWMMPSVFKLPVLGIVDAILLLMSARIMTLIFTMPSMILLELLPAALRRTELIHDIVREKKKIDAAIPDDRMIDEYNANLKKYRSDFRRQLVFHFSIAVLSIAVLTGVSMVIWHVSIAAIFKVNDLSILQTIMLSLILCLMFISPNKKKE
ncbi:MAG: hypothetical protein JNL74_24425 [Fibrobacteres bacterium]|nr:hypothetical protein [Fibrobacterota bacterium]